MELLSEVLNHVVSFGFTMNQKIDTNLLLEADDNLNLLLNELLIFCFSDFTFAPLSASLANFLGLL